jgi:hypothetical protein
LNKSQVSTGSSWWNDDFASSPQIMKTLFHESRELVPQL